MDYLKNLNFGVISNQYDRKKVMHSVLKLSKQIHTLVQQLIKYKGTSVIRNKKLVQAYQKIVDYPAHDKKMDQAIAYHDRIIKPLSILIGGTVKAGYDASKAKYDIWYQYTVPYGKSKKPDPSEVKKHSHYYTYFETICLLQFINRHLPWYYSTWYQI